MSTRPVMLDEGMRKVVRLLLAELAQQQAAGHTHATDDANTLADWTCLMIRKLVAILDNRLDCKDLVRGGRLLVEAMGLGTTLLLRLLDAGVELDAPAEATPPVGTGFLWAEVPAEEEPYSDDRPAGVPESARGHGH